MEEDKKHSAKAPCRVWSTGAHVDISHEQCWCCSEWELASDKECVMVLL